VALKRRGDETSHLPAPTATSGRAPGEADSAQVPLTRKCRARAGMAGGGPGSYRAGFSPCPESAGSASSRPQHLTDLTAEAVTPVTAAHIPPITVTAAVAAVPAG
jgi:hypothetical protein